MLEIILLPLGAQLILVGTQLLIGMMKIGTLLPLVIPDKIKVLSYL
jgi:hypothetical protein